MWTLNGQEWGGRRRKSVFTTKRRTSLTHFPDKDERVDNHEGGMALQSSASHAVTGE